MSNSEDDCIEFDTLVIFFLIMIEHEEYRLAKVIYDGIKVEYKDAEDFLDEYISAMYEGYSNFEFDNIVQSLANRIEILDLRERLVKNLPVNTGVNKIKL